MGKIRLRKALHLSAPVSLCSSIKFNRLCNYFLVSPQRRELVWPPVWGAEGSGASLSDSCLRSGAPTPATPFLPLLLLSGDSLSVDFSLRYIFSVIDQTVVRLLVADASFSYCSLCELIERRCVLNLDGVIFWETTHQFALSVENHRWICRTIMFDPPINLELIHPIIRDLIFVYGNRYFSKIIHLHISLKSLLRVIIAQTSSSLSYKRGLWLKGVGRCCKWAVGFPC